MPEVEISRHEHYRKEHIVDSGRVAKLRLFRKRLKEVISPTVTEEAVIVTLREKRERFVDDKKVEWHDEFTTDHLHPDVVRFKDLIDHKKAAGKEITIKDGVLAYLLVWGYGRKSTIAGFLWAISDDYPEFRYTHKEVREPVVTRPLVGPPVTKIKVRRVKTPLKGAADLVPVIGQALSRLRAEGVILA